MKHVSKKSIVFILLYFCAFCANAQTSFFKDVTAPASSSAIAKNITPGKFRNLSLDTFGLRTFLKNLPLENNINNKAPIIQIPMPNGGTKRFRIWESSVMEPALAAKYPDLKTYMGKGIDDSTAIIKADWTGFGFHALIISSITGEILIDPYTQGDKVNYISYFKSDSKKSGTFSEPEQSKLEAATTLQRGAQILSGPLCTGTQLSTYRLAVACTGEYAIAATGLDTPTVAQTLSAILTSVNRVDGVYRTELALHLVLVANEDHIIFTNPTIGPFSSYENSNASALLAESQVVIDDSIGNANYDVGHTFSTGAGGLSVVGVVCRQSYKAQSVTGLPDPVGDVFSIDYVAHEIGHEFGAHHPFDSNLGYCGSYGQESSTTNDEPGSGSTIMAYAEGGDGTGLCNSDNLQPHSDPYFNGINFDEITQYTVNGSGNTCPVVTPTGNIPPIINAGASYTIPLSTPFSLTGSAIDPEGNPLTYCWEEVDVDGVFCPWNAPVNASFGNAPLFRSFLPVTTPTRYFPKLSDVINGTTTIGEIMPMYARTMNFRLTARDNQPTGGGVCYAQTTVTIDGNSGPFTVTYPSANGIIWTEKELQTVTWNAANTASSPVNCNNVSILLSTDGGLTYPDTLIASTPNSGTAQIQVPADTSTQARIQVVAVGNVFYSISSNNFSIQSDTVSIDVQSQWKVFPNPSSDVINIQCNVDVSNVAFELFNASGELLYKNQPGNIPGNSITIIPISQFAKGIYILKIQSNEGTKEEKVVVL
jgi:hypothetical protein